VLDQMGCVIEGRERTGHACGDGDAGYLGAADEDGYVFMVEWAVHFGL
jgi:hypothetical protein